METQKWSLCGGCPWRRQAACPWLSMHWRRSAPSWKRRQQSQQWRHGQTAALSSLLGDIALQILLATCIKLARLIANASTAATVAVIASKSISLLCPALGVTIRTSSVSLVLINSTRSCRHCLSHSGCIARLGQVTPRVHYFALPPSHSHSHRQRSTASWITSPVNASHFNWSPLHHHSWYASHKAIAYELTPFTRCHSHLRRQSLSVKCVGPIKQAILKPYNRAHPVICQLLTRLVF